MTNASRFPVLAAPQSEKRPVSDTRHGITRVDDYGWMRAENWQDVFRDPATLDPAIRQHLEAENAYQTALMEDTKPLQQRLFDEMKGRIKEDDSSVPSKDGPYAYGTSYKVGGQQPRFFRTPRDGGDETMLLDGDLEGEGKPYFRLASADHSPDHNKMIWGYDDKGSEFFTLKVRDLAKLQDQTDSVSDTTGGGVWNAQSNGFYYTRVDANHRPSRLYYHELGQPESEDRLIYEEKDPGFFLGVGGSSLNDFIFVDIHDHQTSEIWLIPANDATAEPRLVAGRDPGVEYSLTEGGDVFYILTNDEGAKDFKIMSAPVDAPEKSNWTEVVAHKSGRLLLGHSAYSSHLVWLERENGLPRILIRDRKSGEEHAIAFDEEAYALGLEGSAEYDTDIIRFSYSSMTTPTQVYDYNMRTRQRTLLKTQEVPSGHNPEDYVTRRLLAPAPDGELVPVSIVYHRDTRIDGTAPCLLYGYGSYGISIPASFNTNCLSLADRGFIYAVAHVRGGKDKGYDWYENGKRLNKKNTFTDFIAAARHLVAEGYTSHDRIVAQGGSAGGMLMGAIANMAPETFGGIIAEVPFVDVINTMLDDTLPLTPPEWTEWGNPITSATDYEYMASYSPYDNVEAKAYPPILAVAGLTDPRVTYWEPAKWVAKLRELKTDDNPVLFRINMEAGHAGASGRFSRLEEVAYVYAYALKLAGKTQM
ncbi:prolyl oligopeptidase family serine peptidase [Phyllobacterium sp. SYP-B3895]|uniref:S9 family peptidase n=1 Tax=Phyllobacterium sp. SYP-B3895 TaxID=2663240 RepID=UPI00129A0696|nr:S9 family peptidase [Phyllobacterium sp. SYP-B3895]MRG56002.1 prolyl oligopeptidase family serine peptidase [Phyllobacterium sp. SYP-B3895]